MWMTARGFLEVLLISVRHEVSGTLNKAASLRNARCEARVSVTEKTFVSAPAREPDVWHAEVDVKSLKVYWKVSSHKVKNKDVCEVLQLLRDRGAVTEAPMACAALNRHGAGGSCGWHPPASQPQPA